VFSPTDLIAEAPMRIKTAFLHVMVRQQRDRGNDLIPGATGGVQRVAPGPWGGLVVTDLGVSVG
jgi:hypothetical protein